MTENDEILEKQFVILVNAEEQHSLWPRHKDVPAGWSIAYGPDSKTACLQYVERAWPDITPLSVRRKQVG